MESLGWTIEKNTLVVPDEQADALTRFQENVAYPFMNSGFVEPYNAVASATNSLSEKLHCGDVLPYKKDFESSETKFLSPSWVVRSVSGGVGMLLPYTLSGAAAGRVLKDVGYHLHAGPQAMHFFENEASAQILGAAVYDGMRKPGNGETHLGNALGGVAAFGTFAIGHELSRNMSVRNMVLVRTLSGAIGATAQHAVLSYWNTSRMPDMTELGKTSVNGIIMSIVLPESQRLFKSSMSHESSESFGPEVPMGRLPEVNPRPAIPRISVEEVNTIPLREGGEAGFDFFVKTDTASVSGSNNSNSQQDRGKNERLETLTLNPDLQTPGIGESLAPNMVTWNANVHPNSS